MRQNVDGPEQPAAIVAVRDHLHRGAVLFDPFADDRIDQPLSLVVAIDQQLAGAGAIGKADNARIAVEPGVEHKARNQPLMHRAEIAYRVPDVGGVCVEEDVFVDGSHD